MGSGVFVTNFGATWRAFYPQSPSTGPYKVEKSYVKALRGERDGSWCHSLDAGLHGFHLTFLVTHLL